MSSPPAPPPAHPCPAALVSRRARAADKPLKTMRMIMGDAAAPQNSISTGTSMRMSVKVKYARWRVLKDATQDSEKQQRAIKTAMR